MTKQLLITVYIPLCLEVKKNQDMLVVELPSIRCLRSCYKMCLMFVRNDGNIDWVLLTVLSAEWARAGAGPGPLWPQLESLTVGTTVLVLVCVGWMLECGHNSASSNTSH